MASTRKAELALITEALPAHGTPVTVRVAFSGGRDSHVLLHWLAAQRAALAPHRLCAVHVDHRLHADSTHWAQHCAAVCADLDLPLEVLEVDAKGASGESPEAAARAARYRALAISMSGGDLVLTAHHQTDQAETLLLALLRGAGLAGAAAMPARRPFGGGCLLRPLLDWPSSRLAEYAQAHGLNWVPDPSNADNRYDRNFLRQRVLPVLAEHWPAASVALARHAAHAADAQTLLEELATRDGATAQNLPLTQLVALSAPRQRNLLRCWLRAHGVQAPSTARLEELRRQALSAGTDRQPRVLFGTHAVRVWRGRLYLTSEPLPSAPQTTLSWSPAQALELPGLGRLWAQPAVGEGIAAALLGEHPLLEVRFRANSSVPGRSLRKRLQTLAVPPWQRQTLPLLFHGNRLLQIGGEAPLAGWRAGPNQPGIRILWQSAADRTM
ncbi:tRNA lysidine(34) synthetase TilS [Immundisolibacter sp.]|uniref:tRNA lysidine(34) synthetase TilS n=1 Tax=Immundisolibacter sp. TaxID=1934948 RepID=UPI003564504D